MDLVGGSISLTIGALLGVGGDGCLGGLWGITCWHLISPIQNLLDTGSRTSLGVGNLLSVGGTDGCLWGIPYWDLIGPIQNLLNTGRTSLGVGSRLSIGYLWSIGCCGWLWSSTNTGRRLINLWNIPGWELIGPI